MKKKILVLLMAGVLALSMSVAVFAANTSDLVVNALYKEPEIRITVLSSPNDVIINPKRLSLVINGEVDNGQIINTPWGIENSSDCALRVNASVYAKINVKSKMVLNTKSLAGSDTLKSKRAFMYLDKRVTNPGTDLKSLDWDQTEYDGLEQIPITTTVCERDNFITLAGADADGNATAGSVGAFRLSGDAIPNPSVPWDPEVDNVAVNISFTFRPAEPPNS